MKLFCVIALVIFCAGCVSTDTQSGYITPCGEPFRYSNVPLVQVIAAINRCYGESITFEYDTDKSYSISGTLARDPSIRDFVAGITHLYPDLIAVQLGYERYAIRKR